MRRLLPLSILCLAGCDGGALMLTANPPLVLDDALAYFDAPTSSLVIVDPAGRAGRNADRRMVRVTVGEVPVEAISVPRPDDPARRQILVLDPGSGDLQIVRDKTGHIDRLSVGVPLEAIDVSADGRYAVAYQPDGASPTRTLFTFPNTISVVDLAPDAGKATTLRIGTPGARPLRTVFAEPLQLSGMASAMGMTPGEMTTITDEVRLALIFVEGGIVPVDLERATVGEMVPLTSDDHEDVIPAEVLFTNNRGDALTGVVDGVERAFVRTTNGELYVLAISLSPARLAGDTDAMVAYVSLENVVTPDATVYDAEIFFAPAGNALVLAAAGDELILVDGYTGVASRFTQDVTVDALARFVDPASGRALALGFNRGEPQETLLRLDPLGLEQRRASGVEKLRLGSRVADLDIAEEASRAILTYDDTRDLGVLDLAQDGEILDLRFAETLSTCSLAPGGSELWVVGTSPEDQAPHLAQVTLDGSLAAQDVRLDRDGRRVGRTGDWVWVDHPADEGAVTFFPVGDLRRDAGVAFSAVLFVDLLDVPAPADTATW